MRYSIIVKFFSQRVKERATERVSFGLRLHRHLQYSDSDYNLLPCQPRCTLSAFSYLLLLLDSEQG